MENVKSIPGESQKALDIDGNMLIAESCCMLMDLPYFMVKTTLLKARLSHRNHIPRNSNVFPSKEQNLEQR